MNLINEKPFGYSNDVMMAVPNHPLFQSVTNALPRSDLNLIFPYLTVFASTGPLFLSRHVNSYAHSNLTLSILSEELYSGSNEVSYFNHYPGSSWHSWDAKFVFMLWGLLERPWIPILITACIVYVVRQRRRKSRVKVPVKSAEDTV